MHGEAERDAVVTRQPGAVRPRRPGRRWTPATLAASLAELPQAEIGVTADGWPTVVDLLAATGLAPSKSAARRAVAEGGAYLNNVRVTDEDARPGPADLLAGEWLVLRRGKRSLAAVRVSGGGR